MPHTFLLLLGQPEQLVALPLIDPVGSHTIGLVASARDPLTAMTRTLIAFAQEVDLAGDIERLTCGRMIDSIDQPSKAFCFIAGRSVLTLPHQSLRGNDRGQSPVRSLR